jgi:saccharopine dehydrogenase-like NADP-dependent oxidoreductase
LLFGKFFFFLIFSLIPANFIPIIAEVCLKLGKNLVTASYTPPALKTMHEEYFFFIFLKQFRAKKKGLTFLNEIGLDPGIDHCEAKRIIDEIQAKNGTVFFHIFLHIFFTGEIFCLLVWRVTFTRILSKSIRI